MRDKAEEKVIVIDDDGKEVVCDVLNYSSEEERFELEEIASDHPHILFEKTGG